MEIPPCPILFDFTMQPNPWTIYVGRAGPDNYMDRELIGRIPSNEAPFTGQADRHQLMVGSCNKITYSIGWHAQFSIRSSYSFTAT